MFMQKYRKPKWSDIASLTTTNDWFIFKISAYIIIVHKSTVIQYIKKQIYRFPMHTQT